MEVVDSSKKRQRAYLPDCLASHYSRDIFVDTTIKILILTVITLYFYYIFGLQINHFRLILSVHLNRS